MDARIDRIRRKLEASGKSLNPTLSQVEVEDFESRHGIRLPDAYRTYLLELGNGGDGPTEYGVPRLGEVADDMNREEAELWTSLPKVREDFPFTKRWIWEADEETEEGASDDIPLGSLYIGNDGCGMYWHLIINGPARGQVWLFDENGIAPTIPPRDFLQWYEDGLDGVSFWPEDES
ncbi:SMI1/KNR4 family protein [Tundrisphaera lichenicola]|uniref:SMI1/KNR4 family protein n=1 Tax=Tundrisphaera lichenicola TaxID=2029860 RepID=UPI003EB9C14F